MKRVTIMKGSRIFTQGLFVKILSCGRTVVKVGKSEFSGWAVGSGKIWKK